MKYLIINVFHSVPGVPGEKMERYTSILLVIKSTPALTW